MKFKSWLAEDIMPNMGLDLKKVVMDAIRGKRDPKKALNDALTKRLNDPKQSVADLGNLANIANDLRRTGGSNLR